MRMLIYYVNLCIRLLQIKKTFQLDTAHMARFHGPFYGVTNCISNIVYGLFSHLNPVHYGNHISNFPKKNGSLTDFETDVIGKLIELLGANKPEEWTGLVNTGASEGNFHALLMTKLWFQKRGYTHLRVCVSPFTHQSIFKAAELLSCAVTIVPFDNAWRMSEDIIARTIRSLSKNEALCIFVTLGYKETGQSDSVQSISSLVTSVGGNVNCVICIDAALDGLVGPFGFYPFHPVRYSNVCAITVDFHKYPWVTAPAGGILFKKKLIRHQQQYGNSFYETRSLLPALTVWAALVQDVQRILIIRKVTARLHFRKNMFIHTIKNLRIPLEIFWNDWNISVLLVGNRKLYYALKAMNSKFPIRCTRSVQQGKTKYLVKVIFFPDFDEKSIHEMIDIIRLQYEH